MDSAPSVGKLTLSTESSSAEIEPTAKDQKLELSRRQKKLAGLSVRRLKLRAKAEMAAAFAAIIVPVPALILSSPLLSTVVNPVVFTVPCALSIVGGLFWSLNTVSGDELERRSAAEANRAHAEWVSKTIDELEVRFAVRLTPDELFELEYPKETPQAGGMTRYGTIQKLLKDSEDNISLEKVTLIWDENEFRLLRDATNLRELNGKALA